MMKQEESQESHASRPGSLQLSEKSEDYRPSTSNRLLNLNKINQTTSQKLVSQIQLLVWKRYLETLCQRSDLIKLLLPPIMFFGFLILLYATFEGLFYPGGMEEYIVPLAFWVFTQKTVVSIMHEKSAHLIEAMKMMGLLETSYWMSSFIFDGIILGFLISFCCMLMCAYGLFNHANLGVILGLLFLYFLSVVPFCFFICAFFDTPQSAGQVTLGILLGFYVIYIAANIGTSASDSIQTVCCLFPPLALQIASGSFKASYDGISYSVCCNMMVLDTFLYSILAWYFAQVWPSDVGVSKPWYFPIDPSYWDTSKKPLRFGAETVGASLHSPLFDANTTEDGKASIPKEEVNESLVGKPTVRVSNLLKTFTSGVPGTSSYTQQVAVNNLSFDMYENQIFCLLGHNGAGKTTTINMLDGLLCPDYSSLPNSGATIYGKSINQEMEAVRQFMGVCPQHDVLFEHLTVKEHIMFFSRLKGFSESEAEEEALSLTTQFHLDQRLDHMGHELSGGQKRKLSVAIAVCGGSKFIVLDEPTAGMDPLARRELWDLLAELRESRTMLLTTHYMDEADILGDRVGIMSLGKMQCIGSTQFLKTTYGAGYRLICQMKPVDSADTKTKHATVTALTTFVKQFIPEAQLAMDEGDDAQNQICLSLPFSSITEFGRFFTEFEAKLDVLQADSFGVQITSLEDVFLKVGEDHSVTPKDDEGEEGARGIGSSRQYQFDFISQTVGITLRRLRYAKNDIVTVPLLGLPIAVAIAAAVIYGEKVLGQDEFLNDTIVALMYMGAYFGVPGLLSEFIIRERVTKLRTVLTVMGCDFKAYWLGTLIADYCLLLIPTLFIYVSWFSAGMTDFYSSDGGLCFLIFLIFNLQIVAFSYIGSYIFSTPKSVIAFMPMFIIILMLTPSILTMMVILIFDVGLGLFSVPTDVSGGVFLWGIMLLTPHGALFAALWDTTQDISEYISDFPPVYASIMVMLFETAVFLYVSHYTDSLAVCELQAEVDPQYDEKKCKALDIDVIEERERAYAANAVTDGDVPLRLSHLRKVFPSKRFGAAPVVATEDMSMCVGHGEIFGLLGANGAGKTTTLSMMTRHLTPTAGDAFIANRSILSQFSQGATHLGVVTQNNSLWELLSVEDHLYLFARLRGVPEEVVEKVVAGTIDQLELTPHRKKLAGRLSGGMKRKLCVAVALIGDPEVVLLDEPSAGLDPVSRRNLWTVILKTMKHRAVILTTHSMEEAEALCGRIGIMVQGQLRALGTKQHLKEKFGSGYELVVKLMVTSANHQEILENCTKFVKGLFPHAHMISDNGGLVTYQVPKDEMKMGHAFTHLQANKAKLNIEDYSIAQPTLEQVFIRTVQDNTPKVKDTNRGSTLSVHGSSRLLSECMSEGEENEGDAKERPSYMLQHLDYAFEEEVNGCNCTRSTTKKFTAVATFFFFLFFVIAIVTRDSLLVAFYAVALIVACTGCNLLCLPCCQPTKGADE